MSVARTELGSAVTDDGELVASLCQMSDLHVMDVASPMRFEWIETQATDPRWHPLLHMHRPQEALVPWAVAAHVDALRTGPTGATRGAQLDLVVCTGDNIDNAQRNELDAYLALVSGGRVSLSPLGGPQDAGDQPTGRVWPYWCPRGDVADDWKPRGYPRVDDLLERASAPIESSGLGVRWTSLPGNHDLLCQGTSIVTDALLAVATGPSKALWPPDGFAPDDALALFVDEPERFVGSGARPVAADPERRVVTLTEWVERHVAAGASGLGPGLSGPDAIVDLGEVSVILLDTNHPAGDYQGSIGQAQLQWLESHLAAADRDGRLVVLASHHGVDSLVNTRGDDPSRRLAADLLAVVHRHPCVVAWLAGHRHIHRVTPRPGPSGGFWEITTGSIVDWPVERRSIEIVRHAGGAVEIVSTVQAHDAPADSLAGIHRQVAQLFAGQQVRSAMAGRDVDRDVRLFVDR